MGYLFSAYFVLWAITFGYLFLLGSRQKRLQRELELFRQEHQTTEPRMEESS
jgi:CcmD family protein